MEFIIVVNLAPGQPAQAVRWQAQRPAGSVVWHKLLMKLGWVMMVTVGDQQETKVVRPGQLAAGVDDSCNKYLM
jgi:hypothetical protein